MTLVGVRSTAPSRGLVAILVENGGPAVLAVPVNAREGLLLSAGRSARSPSWTALLEQTCRALDGRIRSAELDVDAESAGGCESDASEAARSGPGRRRPPPAVDAVEGGADCCGG